MKYNNGALYKEHNETYRSQFACVAFICAFTFKTAMLPSYLAASAGHLAYMSVAIMMLFDFVMYFLVYFVASNINVMKERAPYVIAPVMAGTLVLSFSRLLVLFSETVSYTSSALFDQGKINFILIALLAVIAYVVLKGGKVLSRLSQIIFLIAAFLIIGIMILMRVDLDFGALAPFNDGWDMVFDGIDKHYMWYGDFIPLLFLNIVPSKRGKEGKWIFPTTAAAIYITVVGFMILCILIYGDALQYTPFAFNKIAVFNKLTQLIGATNFPVIIAWLLMSIIKLSILTYACVMSLTYFIRNKILSLCIIVVVLGSVIGTVMPNANYSYEFATGFMRYVVCALSYSIPIVLAIYVALKKRRGKGTEAKNKGDIDIRTNDENSLVRRGFVSEKLLKRDKNRGINRAEVENKELRNLEAINFNAVGGNAIARKNFVFKRGGKEEHE